jgi:hypothetical protein
MISSSSINRKRQRLNNKEGKTCSFCQQTLAAVLVLVPVANRKKRAESPFCLSCYYTTSAVRQDAEKYVSTYNQARLDEQLPRVQALFSEVYVELQKELEEESEKSFQRQKNDPLAMLHQAPKRRQKAPPRSLPITNANKKAGKEMDGGFLRGIAIPERLLKTQQLQAKLQKSQIERMNRVATKERQSSSVNLFKRRKASRKSIWNLAMDPNTSTATKEDLRASIQHISTCSCGSNNVTNFGNITSRNQDLRKGETWGMKDRGGEVVTKYQCNECGKKWQEED